jgi:peptide deformylase
MAILKIRTFGDPVLRQKARPVERITELHRKLIEDMFDTMRDAPGVGLAAPQVGVLERIFVWELEEESGVVINPKIVSRSPATIAGEEGCLSLPGVVFDVDRSVEVVVEGLDQNGEPVRIESEEMLARIVQHEIDHLDGVLFIDHLPEESRRQALGVLRNLALGLPVETQRAPAEEAL